MCLCPGCDEMSCGLPDCDECDADRSAAMSEQAPEEPPADAGVEQRVDSLESKVDKILGILSGGDSHTEETPAGQPDTNIAHEIRAQLEERDKKAAAEAAEQGKSDRLAAAEAKIAELAEKPPAPPPTRRAKIMGWT